MKVVVLLVSVVWFRVGLPDGKLPSMAFAELDFLPLEIGESI